MRSTIFRIYKNNPQGDTQQSIQDTIILLSFLLGDLGEDTFSERNSVAIDGTLFLKGS